MTPGRAEILTGFFVLLTLAVGVGFALMLGGSAWLAGGVEYTAYLTNSADLREQTAVHFEGRRVGRVTDVAWDQPRRAYKITMRVPAHVPVKSDSTMQMRGVKLLGDMFVEITAGTPGAAPAPPGSEIAAIPFRAMTESVDRLTEEIGPVLQELQRAIADIRILVDPDGAGGDITAALKSLRTAAATLDRGAASLETLIADDEEGLQGVAGRANKLLADNEATVSRGLTDAAKAAESLRNLVDEERGPVSEVLAGLDGVVQSLEATVRRLDETVARMDTQVADVGGAATKAIGQSERMMRENQTDIRAAVLAARNAAENLKLAAAKVADRPSTLLFDSEDETSKAARAKRDFEQQLRERGRAGRYGKE
ncbi:MAG: MlaD family protein [Planctomycetota bacterium]|jgi:ABC-type transporter Mla subunit MlaD